MRGTRKQMNSWILAMNQKALKIRNSIFSVLFPEGNKLLELGSFAEDLELRGGGPTYFSAPPNAC